MNHLNDSRIKYLKNIPQDTYHKYCKNYYSQNGEDGIIEKLIQELDLKTGYCCEFGASDGITTSNTYNLIKNHKFFSIQIECDKILYQRLLNTYKNFPNVQCYNEYVTSENLTNFLEDNKFPHNFDILSIDIDSFDYEIWKNFNSFEPKIVIIEINTYRDPVVEETHQIKTKDYFNLDPLQIWYPNRVAVGSSFMSMIKLGLSKNYIPVSFTGNIIFVHKKFISNLKEFPYILSENPFDYLTLYTEFCMWENEWFTNTGLKFNVGIRDHFLKYKSLDHIDFGLILNNL
jgi:hypothetical protein